MMEYILKPILVFKLTFGFQYKANWLVDFNQKSLAVLEIYAFEEEDIGQ